MKKLLLAILLLCLVALAACSPGATPNEEVEENNVEVKDDSVAVDTNDNGVADVEVEQDEEVTEVTVDFDDVQDEETQEAVAAAAGNEDYCVAGSTYTYESEDGNVDSKVIGLEMYKGSEWCKANSLSEIETPAGTISTDTTYYFDNTYKEFWVKTTVSSAIMPEPQVSEVHIVDGQVA